MNNDITSLLEESINLELNVSNLYSCFKVLFPDDAAFWWNLQIEEKNHAALIRSGKKFFEPLKKFPHDLLAPVLQSLKNTNSRLDFLIKKYDESPPSREETLNIALKIENSAGELHFQNFMDGKANSKIDDIFKELNKDDKDHAKRIRCYMEKHGIAVQSNE